MNQFVVVASINAMSQVFGWVTCVTHLMAGVTRSRDCATPIISSLLVILGRQEIQNEEFIFYCFLLSKKEQLNWVLSMKQKVECI